jgi:hypothetical protein
MLEVEDEAFETNEVEWAHRVPDTWRIIRESVDLGYCVLGPLTHFVATIAVRL